MGEQNAPHKTKATPPIMGNKSAKKNTIGDYAYDSDHYFTAINLVEINFSLDSTENLEETIKNTAFEIAKKLHWEVFDPDLRVVMQLNY